MVPPRDGAQYSHPWEQKAQGECVLFFLKLPRHGKQQDLNLVREYEWVRKAKKSKHIPNPS